MNRKILFIGSFNKDKIVAGDTVKNNILVESMIKYKVNMEMIDTTFWRKNKIATISKIAGGIARNYKSEIMISLNTQSAKKFIYIMDAFKLIRKININYIVIGGNLPKVLDENERYEDIYRRVKRIFVETKGMETVLKNKGLKNVHYLPNFKDYNYVPKEKRTSDKIKICFFSRVCREKGIEEVIGATEKMSSFINVETDIYGPIQESYNEHFKQRIYNSACVFYKGVLTPNANRTYEILSDYDLMLFPTYHDGEGFPGVIIDSFIAGVPVMATKWRYNGEIVEEGKTGWLVNIKSEEEIIRKIMKIYDNKDMLIRMRSNCIEKAKEFHVSRVIPELLRIMDVV